jgi:hypothetical protein
MNKTKFVEIWAKSLELGSASVFVGAGLSQAAGYPSWKALLRDIAKELGLDIEYEHDLAAVAQYSVNKAVGKRHRLASLIVKEFPPKLLAPEPFNLLARLPLRHIWTTNYDTLVETAWRNERKHLDVKSRNEDLGVDSPWAHAILYKMHGSVEHPSDVVIAKDDYELYRSMRPGFLQLLTGHLVSKQVLFLGFSFTDPNLSHLFGSIREAFREHGPEHYAIVRRPQLGTGKNSKKKLKTETIRHTLWVEDLQRYGIQSVEIDNYKEIDDVLKAVALKLARRSVFVSGSFPDTTDAAHTAKRRRVEEFAYQTGRLIAERKQRLVSGFGLVVGSACITGALSVVLGEDTPNFDKSLLLRPFPQGAPTGVGNASFRSKYREGMIQQAGACIFIAGIKATESGNKVVFKQAEGVIEEFEMAKKLGCAIIPLGVTGGSASLIWRRVESDYSSFWAARQRKDFELLNDVSIPVTKIMNAVKRMLSSLE